MSQIPKQFQRGFKYPVLDQELPGTQTKLDPPPLNDATADGKLYKAAGKLEGKKAVVTAGDSGIGRSVALLYALEGADVTLTYLPQEKKDVEETKQEIHEKTGGKRKITLLEINLTTEQICQELIEKHKAEHGGVIDILALNHGLQHANTDIATLPTEDWMETFRVNIHSFFFIIKAALPYMKEGGSIIMNASINFAIGHPELIDYTATKGAIIGFMRGLSNQIAPSKGIRVNAVAPGPIWTPLIAATMTKESKESFGLTTPLGRAGQPTEIATSFVFLGSADSSYITGQVFHVNGGSVIN